MFELSLCDQNDAYICDYSDAHILVKRTISIAPQECDNPNNINREVAFQNCVPFTDSIYEINNTQIVNAKFIDAVMLMYNLMVIGDNYSKTSGRLQQYYSDEPFSDAHGAAVDFPAANSNSSSFM